MHSWACIGRIDADSGIIHLQLGHGAQRTISSVLVEFHGIGDSGCDDGKRSAEGAPINIPSAGIVIDPRSGIGVEASVSIHMKFWEMSVSEDHHTGIAL